MVLVCFFVEWGRHLLLILLLPCQLYILGFHYFFFNSSSSLKFLSFFFLIISIFLMLWRVILASRSLPVNKKERKCLCGTCYISESQLCNTPAAEVHNSAVINLLASKIWIVSPKTTSLLFGLLKILYFPPGYSSSFQDSSVSALHVTPVEPVGSIPSWFSPHPLSLKHLCPFLNPPFTFIPLLHSPSAPYSIPLCLHPLPQRVASSLFQCNSHKVDPIVGKSYFLQKLRPLCYIIKFPRVHH